jgi:hypothetical protein
MTHNQTRTIPQLPKRPAIWYYVGVVSATLLCSWFIQLTYYLIMTHRNPLAFSGEKVLTNYTTGFIGDLVIVPLINVAIVYILLHGKVRLSRLNYVCIILAGLTADFLLHFGQGVLRLTNWSMPQPFHWNFVSYFHMFYFFFQISFVFLFFYLAYRGVWRRSAGLRRATYSAFSLIVVFIALLLYDYLPVQSTLARLAQSTHLFH